MTFPIKVRRGDIFACDLNEGTRGAEQMGIRPVLIIQNEINNTCSPTTIVAPLSRSKSKQSQFNHVYLDISNYKWLKYNSIILLEQIRCIDKSRLLNYTGTLNEEDMSIVNSVISFSLGLPMDEISLAYLENMIQSIKQYQRQSGERIEAIGMRDAQITITNNVQRVSA